MPRFAAVLLLALAPTAARADDDGWTGQWVFPRTNPVPVLDPDGKVLIQWSVSAAKVTWMGKEWVTIRHSQYPGPYEGSVRKSEVVRLADAPAFFTEQIRADASDVWAWANRAKAWTLKGEHDNAIKDMTEAIRLDPSVWAYISRGLAWDEKKEYDKAIADYTEAIRLDPKHALPFNNRGKVRAGKKEYDKAIADYTEAIRLDPKYALAFSNRGAAWAGKKEYGRAIADLDEAIRLAPKDALLFNNKACCYALQGKTDLALADLRRSLELGYSNFKHMETDTDLDSIRDDPRYQKLLKKFMK